jgi:hypothetical protein
MHHLFGHSVRKGQNAKEGDKSKSGKEPGSRVKKQMVELMNDKATEVQKARTYV